jgi:hypothetical protein
MHKLTGGVIAVAVTAAVAATGAGAAAWTRSEHRASRRAASSAKSIVTSTTTSTSLSTTTTTVAPNPVDPLAGIDLLQADGRYIYGLDAQGTRVRTLVTAYEDRAVEDVQMMPDHHTIWYRTGLTSRTAGPPDFYCDDVVRLDLATNTRTLIAHADEFSVSAKGERVLLTNEVPNSSCATGWIEGRDVVRDVATGAESPITDANYMNPVLSPDGGALVATECTSDMYGCHIALREASLPTTLGAQITLHPVNNAELSFLSLRSRADGLYAIVDTHPQSCGCGGRVDRSDNDITVRRLSWSDLGGTGTTLFTLQGPRYFDMIMPSVNTIYAMGSEKVDAPTTLYRIDDGGAAQVRSLSATTAWYMYGVPPLAG